MRKTAQAKLQKLLSDRNIQGKVYYSRKRPIGWMHDWYGSVQRLGYVYSQAVELIEHGTMDFMAGKTPSKGNKDEDVGNG